MHTSHITPGRIIVLRARTRRLLALGLVPSWSSPHAPPSLANFNLCSFPLTNATGGQQLPKSSVCPSSELLKLRVLSEHPELAIDVRSEGGDLPDIVPLTSQSVRVLTWGLFIYIFLIKRKIL